MRQLLLLSLACLLVFACKNKETNENKTSTEAIVEKIKDTLVLKDLISVSVAESKKELLKKGYQVFDYVDEKTKDTIIMQQYFMAFLKKGKNRTQSEEEARELQTAHLAHLGKMYDLGYADISGPFGDDGDIRGITIYNVPTLAIADSLANSDPMVKAGRLEIDIHPWWAAKGFPLR